MSKPFKIKHLAKVALLILSHLGTGCFIASAESPPKDPVLKIEALNKVRELSEQTLEEIKRLSPQLRMTKRIDRIGPALLLKMNIPLNGDTIEDQAHDFISRFSNLWGRLQVTIEKIEQRRDRSIVHLIGKVDGILLKNQQSKLTIKNGQAQHLSNGLGALVDYIPSRITEAEAIKSAEKDLSGQVTKLLSIKNLAVSYEPGRAHQVFELRFSKKESFSTLVVLVDGRDGAVLNVTKGEVK